MTQLLERDDTALSRAIRSDRPILKGANLRNALKQIEFSVHTLHQQMQFVMSRLAMGRHGTALLACRADVKELGDVGSQLAEIRRLPAEHASRLPLVRAQK